MEANMANRRNAIAGPRNIVAGLASAAVVAGDIIPARTPEPTHPATIGNAVHAEIADLSSAGVQFT